jgi:RNA-directed DNA polymerase
MKEPYSEGVANHTGPESCVGSPRGGGEALTGVRAGWVFNREMFTASVGADRHGRVWKATPDRPPRCARPGRTPRGRRPHARTETPRTGIGRSRSPAWEMATHGPRREPIGKTAMYGGEKSDRPIVPEKLSNKGRGAPRPAERVEGRGLTKGNACSKTGSGPSAGETCQMRRMRTTGRSVSYWLMVTALCVMTQGRSPVR